MVDDQLQGRLVVNCPVVVELDDRYLEVAELGDHLDLNVVAAEDEEPKVLGLLLPLVQHRLQELVEQHHFAAQELVQVREQQQVLLW